MMLAFASCKKNSPDPVPDYNLAGTTWTGTVSIPAAPVPVVNQPMHLSFNAAGSLAGDVSNGSGTYALAGSWSLVPGTSTVNMNFTIVSVTGPYVATATLTTNNTKLETGVMTNATMPAGNGTFTLTRN